MEPPLNCSASPAVALRAPAAAASASPLLPPMLLLLLPLASAVLAASPPPAGVAAPLAAAGIGVAAPLLALLPLPTLLLLLSGLGATAAATVGSAKRPARLNLRPLIQQRVASSTLAYTISLQIG